MLPADPARRAPARSDDSPLTLAFSIGAGLLLVYALGVGLGLLGGDIAPATAYGWMLPIPLALAACYGFGFARQSALRDTGLVVSALGWIACAGCLLALQGAARAALASGLRLDQMTPTPLSWFFALLAVGGIVIGGLLSLRFWQNEKI